MRIGLHVRLVARTVGRNVLVAHLGVLLPSELLLQQLVSLNRGHIYLPLVVAQSLKLLPTGGIEA